MRITAYMMVLFTLVILLPGCMTTSENLSSTDAFSRLDRIRNTVSRTGSLPREMLLEKTGETGFYYVISSEGIVIFHPNAYVAGTNMSTLPMIKEIISRQRGFGTFEQGGIVRTVFYTALPDGSILCLSIDPSEVRTVR